MTAEQLSQQRLETFQESVEKWARLRDKLEDVTKQRRNLNRGMVEQREELKDLLENRKKIVDELEHNLNDAVEELNVSLMYHYYVLFKISSLILMHTF